MDFEYSDDQRMLADSVARLLSDRYTFDARRLYLKEGSGWSAALWEQYAELGLLGVPFAEAHGGFGGGAVDVMMVMEAFGRSLVLEPFLASVVLGGAALRHGGTAAQQAELLPRVIDGSLKLAFAHGERQARYDLSDVLTTAARDGAGWVLEGAKSVVFHGDCADRLVVSARTAGDRCDAGGITLFLVDAAAAGVARRGYALHDGMRAAEISLSGVRVGADAVLGPVDGGLALVERITEAGIAAMAAEMVGAMEAMHSMTLDYAKTRQHFGKPIGSNQVVQHRLAEMLVELEQARSMAMLAAMTLDEPDDAERARAISMVKLAVGQAARFVSQNAVQLHGGIGMTEEYAVGHYFRRAMVFEHSFGDSAHHLQRIAATVR
ncbi:MAG: pimeloyl-CoA dehydrogenase small subunit [Acetobacteraceae bacterium SCN 69-10]|nr:MAG: pimeloyl-CoA dehydrogenase small subunit [Acetobacteraceae bacterium SCN 69-10]